jgi:hypothetical protein
MNQHKATRTTIEPSCCIGPRDDLMTVMGASGVVRAGLWFPAARDLYKLK